MPDYNDLKLALSGSNITTLSPNEAGFEKYVKLERGADASPTLIIKPKTEEELQKAIELMNKMKLAAVLYAGGTGLVSAQRAENIAVIDLNYLDQFNSITLANGDKFEFSKIGSKLGQDKKAEKWQEELQAWADEKGYTKDDFKGAVIDCQTALPVGSINYVLNPIGIEFPLDTGAVSIGGGMTIGAGVANATHGTFGLMHGTASDLTINARAINGKGEIRNDKGPDISERVIDENNVVINSAVAQYGYSSVGTQGVFSVITNVELKTTEVPEQRILFMVKADSLEEVNKLRRDLLENGFKDNLRQFEVMNKVSTELVRIYEPSKYYYPFTDENGKYTDDNGKVFTANPIDSKYVALVEFIGDGKALDLEAKIFGHFINYPMDRVATGGGSIGADIKLFEKLRHSAPDSSKIYANELGGSVKHRVTPDVSVPLNQLDSYADKIISTLEKQRYEVNIFGHVGIGAFHLHVYSPADKPLDEIMPSSKTRKEELLSTIYDITVEHKGSCWSEHGVGTAAANEWDKRTPKEEVDKLIAMKLEDDPNNTLSPQSNAMDKHLGEIRTNKKRAEEMKKICEKMGFKSAVTTIDEWHRQLERTGIKRAKK